MTTLNGYGLPKRTTAQVVATIDLLLGGAKIVGRAVHVRGVMGFELWALVANVDGCGRKDTMLCCLDQVADVVDVRRVINARGGF